MSRALPTVRVRNPGAPDMYMVINACDRTDEHDVWHEQADDYVEQILAPSQGEDEALTAVRLLGKMMARKIGCSDEEWAALPSDERKSLIADAEREIDGTDALRVGKGPGGRWYVTRGRDRVGSGFATEQEATAERERLEAA